ncbi:MAG TPA: hydrolase [Flavisolibacter sp.]|jgi:nicotinamidase-related amidase|nr:hydrolase [Flavisolibacter sp.]
MKKCNSVLIVLFILTFIATTSYAQIPSPKLLTPTNHTLVMIDLQSQMTFATKSISTEELRSNTGIVAGTAKIFNVPTVITTAAEKSFSGPVLPELEEFFPKATSGYIDRTNMNAWEDAKAHKAIVDKGKKKLVFAGLWTEVCIVDPVLSAMEDGYDVYFIADDCGGVSKEAHDRAVQRMIQAGAQPLSSIQYILELQRDWARKSTYKGVTDLIKKYGGVYGIGIQYAREVIQQ